MRAADQTTIRKLGSTLYKRAETKLRRLLATKFSLPFTVFGSVLVCGLYVVEQNHEIRETEGRMIVQQVLVAQELELSRRLSYMLSSTYFLAQEVAHSQGKFESFEAFAETLLERMEGISNLQLAPDGIITRIYPLAGNELAIGHNILKDDKRREEAKSAVTNRELTLAGPFTLIQGGVAVIGRNPVFLLQPDGSEKFWGFTSAMILLDDLIGGSGMSALPSAGYAYELSRKTPETGLRSVFASSDDPESAYMQSIEIQVPNGSWTLRVGPTNNDEYTHYRLGQFAALLIALLLGVLTRRIANEPETLRRQVATQTQDLHRLAYFDGLTGLPNRHQFTEVLRDGLQQTWQPKIGLALLLMDLDHFKEVNDTLGHDAGDLLLCEATDRMSRRLPEGAIIARLGGDEFTVVVVGQDYSAVAEQISLDIIEAIKQPFELQGNEVHVSASIGIASASSPDKDPGELLKRADQAMYDVKRHGRGGFVHYNEAIQQEVSTRASLASDLRHAVRRDELQLLYQPIVNSVSGQVEKAEALLRWHHPVRGMISPAVFIPLAEDIGLIHELGDWVFEEAIRQVHNWRQTYHGQFQISINASPMQFMSDGQIPRWVATANAHGVEAGSVLIEITESVLLENDRNNTELLSLLKEAGIQVALDDFGTGYSSLSYLKMLDIDYLKIDRSFIQGLTPESDDLVLCRAIVFIAKSLGYEIVAEGVETKAQEHLLRSIGCHYMQGFLYSKPIAPHDFERQYFECTSTRSLPDQAA